MTYKPRRFALSETAGQPSSTLSPLHNRFPSSSLDWFEPQTSSISFTHFIITMRAAFITVLALICALLLVDAAPVKERMLKFKSSTLGGGQKTSQTVRTTNQ
jgi:hypothetical protein